jgi:uncharacterized protein DUF4234
MAEVLNIGGQEFKKRSPLVTWGLSIITIFVYYWIWYYKINDEARRYLSDENIKPGISVLAVPLRIVLIIPPFVSIYRTGERVTRMQEKAGVTNTISPALALLAALVFIHVHVPYIQENLNKVWRRYEASAPVAGVPAPGPPPQGGAFSG